MGAMQGEEEAIPTAERIFSPASAQLALAAFATLFFSLALLYGVWLNYSPIPLSDSWSGIVGFYLDALDDPWAWWRQHYDHRILVSKAFFWLDMHYFGGSNAPLITLNLLLMLAICATFQAYARQLFGVIERETHLLLLASLALLALSWMQRQNITWEFQNQFYWVYLLPLLAFFALARSVTSANQVAWQVTGLLLGVASAFSMANGIFALPLLALLNAGLFRSWRRASWPMVLALVCIGLFFLGYEHTPGREQGTLFLRQHPLSVLTYVLAYLGNPFYWIFGQIEAAVAAGLLFVALVLLLLRSVDLRRSPFALALLAYVFFIVCTAGVTAIGRAYYNLELAASSRYTTPALSAWSALLLLVLARGSQHFPLPARVRAAFLALFLLLSGQQLHAFYFDDPSLLFLTPHTKEFLAIGLKLGVHDSQAMLRLSPFSPPGEVPMIIDRARAARISIFAENSAEPTAKVGRPVAELNLVACSVEQMQLALVDPNMAASTVQGRLPDAAKQHWRYVYFVDARQRVNGVAVVGRVVFNSLSQERGRELFDGYVLGTPVQEVYCE